MSNSLLCSISDGLSHWEGNNLWKLWNGIIASVSVRLHWDILFPILVDPRHRPCRSVLITKSWSSRLFFTHFYHSNLQYLETSVGWLVMIVSVHWPCTTKAFLLRRLWIFSPIFECVAPEKYREIILLKILINTMFYAHNSWFGPISRQGTFSGHLILDPTWLQESSALPWDCFSSALHVSISGTPYNLNRCFTARGVSSFLYIQTWKVQAKEVAIICAQVKSWTNHPPSFLAKIVSINKTDIIQFHLLGDYRWSAGSGLEYHTSSWLWTFCNILSIQILEYYPKNCRCTGACRSTPSRKKDRNEDSEESSQKNTRDHPSDKSKKQALEASKFQKAKFSRDENSSLCGNLSRVDKHIKSVERLH